MKRLLVILLGGLLLTACGNGADKEYTDQLKEAEKNLEEAKEDTKELEETLEDAGITKEDDADDSTDLTAKEVAEILAYETLGEGDSITDVIINEGEIKAVIEVSDESIISDKSILAETIYSRAGDSLLEYGGWEVLTIEFVDVGEVSMNRNEAETNEYGMNYFPLEKIIGQLE